MNEKIRFKSFQDPGEVVLSMSLARIQMLHSIPEARTKKINIPTTKLSVPPLEPLALPSQEHVPPLSASFGLAPKLNLAQIAGEMPSAAAPPALQSKKTFFSAVGAVFIEFCLVLAFQLLFYFEKLHIVGAGTQPVAVSLGGVLLMLTGICVLVVNSSWEKTQWVFVPLHACAYLLCCCWLSTYINICFIALSAAVLFNLLSMALLTAMMGSFSIFAFVVPLPPLVAATVLLNVYVTPWYYLCPMMIYLVVQNALQGFEGRRMRASPQRWVDEPARGFSVSLSLRFWWRRFGPQFLLLQT